MSVFSRHFKDISRTICEAFNCIFGRRTFHFSNTIDEGLCSTFYILSGIVYQNDLVHSPLQSCGRFFPEPIPSSHIHFAATFF